GVTTNPTHLSKEGGDPKKLALEICSVMSQGEVSVEITEQDPEKVYQQAKEIAKLAKNVVVKIPCHAQYYFIIKRLVDEGIPLNITLVFTLLQALMMSKLGVRYVSPFVGRWDDIDVDGVQIIHEMRQMMYRYGFKTGLLAASLRHVRHFHLAVMVGADVATVPVDVFEKAITHPLTDSGIEKFNVDWQKLGIKQFP
ncbi:MAG: transaldolase family protein, partial [bacterium]|nr:transaldolase family protein [bacterium]